MSRLTSVHKWFLEEFLRMKDGYVPVLESDRKFQIFFQDEVGIDIEDPKYKRNGTSKANRMRAFWVVESNHLIALCLEGLLELCKMKSYGIEEDYMKFNKIIEELKSCDLDYIFEGVVIPHDKIIKDCCNSIAEGVKAGRAENAMDRLHTLFFRWLRIAKKTEKTCTMDALYSEYVNGLKGFIDDRVYKVLKSHTGIVQQLNEIRNKRSLAHPNPPPP
jgi:Abortive infection C-terminus